VVGSWQVVAGTTLGNQLACAGALGLLGCTHGQAGLILNVRGDEINSMAANKNENGQLMLPRNPITVL
jgi:hypothetical protein